MVLRVLNDVIISQFWKVIAITKPRYYPHSNWHFTTHTHTQSLSFSFSVTCKKEKNGNTCLNSSKTHQKMLHRLSDFKIITQFWSQTCITRDLKQALTKWHKHSQRIQMTQNKHKATHDQLRETKLPPAERGETFSASVVQLGKAWVRLLFSFFHFLAREHQHTCWQEHSCLSFN